METIGYAMESEVAKQQWEVAMKENEELRRRLHDVRDSLEAAGGDGDPSDEHWRELCVSIAKSAEDEKGQILEQIDSMRDELSRTSSTVDTRSDALEKLKAQAEADRKAADEWSEKANAVIKSRNELNAALYNADATAAETEADSESAQTSIEDQRGKTLQLEAEAEQLGEKLREEELLYEQTLTEVYNAHREQVDALNVELTANEEDLQQGSAAMNQWRTQWEEELTEKNSIDAELLTLRSEFEKSSATYDREIEGLKELLEKERLLREEMSVALQGEETELSQYGDKIVAQRSEMDTLIEASSNEAKATGDAEKELEAAKTATEANKRRYEEAVGKRTRAEGELESLRTAVSGETASQATASWSNAPLPLPPAE